MQHNHSLAAELLKARFDKAVTIPGTLQYHAHILIQNAKLQFKKHNNWWNYREKIEQNDEDSRKDDN